MLLSDLISVLPKKSQVSQSPEITGIDYDSRKVKPGSLFVCISGDRFDGREFASEAVRAGASAVVAEDSLDLPVPVVIVPDAREALPLLANKFYGYPSRSLKMVGVTGTKGKTTTTYMIESIFTAAGMEAGLVGTIGARLRGESVPQDRTTPESVDLQALLARMVSEGVTAATMEVSSHALVKGRTEGVEYDVGIFTNLTHDHLDFHNTLDEYLEAKLILFREYPSKSGKPFTGVINADDPRSERVVRATDGRVLTYGIKNPADVSASNISAAAESVTFTLSHPGGSFEVALGLGGMFNVYNALAAAGAGLALGIGEEAVKAGLESLTAVPGRFEYVNCGQDFGVLVDYAHTPDSLENVLRSARELTRTRLIAVFGCGGDRDRTKRPLMGKIGSEMADICIVTSDNPRSEDPEAIIREIVAGTEGEVEAIPDRREAIRRALEIAGPGDLVVIAGKGHETYQIFPDRTIHFDDREVVREILTRP
ncbi:MAG: UDP-N-acetylmuramoyl-L-alanyl-D-glutamate--2,6-diaminopimelate ligase [Armatimonadota bacterium]